MNKIIVHGRNPVRWVVCLCLQLFVGVTLFANPIGEEVKHGDVKFIRDGNKLTITQGSDKAIINWKDFSINKEEWTQFLQPGSNSAALNRVVGVHPSQLLGRLDANGKIFLVNPNGILVGPGAQINASTFVASTLDVADDNFLAGGDLKFFGNSTAAVQNYGTIQAQGGDVFLIGHQVQNAGTILAPNGTVGLAAGQDVVLKEAGPERLAVRVAAGQPSASEGVTNTGIIEAASAELRAAGGNVYAMAINNSGTIKANKLVNDGGRIILDVDGGNITNTGKLEALGGQVAVQAYARQTTPVLRDSTIVNSGTISVASTAAGTKGGSIDLFADRVQLNSTSVLDASGQAGGGAIRVGGDYQGSNPDAYNARVTLVKAGAQLRADTLSADGDGGKVIVWSDGTTKYSGDISAKGGSQSGNGGMAEVSGKSYLDFQGTADLTAANGDRGTLLLDPTNISIRTSLPNINGDSTTGDDITSAEDLDNAAEDQPGATSVITAGAVTTLLNSGNLVLAASNDITYDGSGGGTIERTATTGLATLTLQAGRDITIMNGVFNAGAYTELSLTFNADTDSTGGGRIVITSSTINTNGGSIIMGGGADPTATAASGWGAGALEGVKISASTINLSGVSTNGGISIRGQGYNGSSTSQHGVLITNNSTITTAGVGAIYINGLAGGTSGASDNIGVKIDGLNTALNARDGNITITGVGANYGSNNFGVLLTGGAYVGAIGTGNISINGTGGGNNSTDLRNQGVRLDGSAAGIDIVGGTGQINIVGTGGYGTAATGVHSEGTVNVSGGGPIGYTGIANNGMGSLTHGVNLMHGHNISATSVGTVGVNGQTASLGGSGVFFQGDIDVVGGFVQLDSTNGDLVLGNGTYGGNITRTGTPNNIVTLRSNTSVIINNNTKIVSTTGSTNTIINADADGNSTGAIYISRATFDTHGGDFIAGGGAYPSTTSATGTTALSHGIEIADTSITTGVGMVSLKGQGAFGNSTSTIYTGVKIDSNSSITTTAGPVSINGSGGGSGNSTVSMGVNIAGDITTDSGTINISAQAGSGTYGEAMLIAGDITANTTGAIHLNGYTSANHIGGGVRITSGGRLETNSGSINVTGTTNLTTTASGYSGLNVQGSVETLSGAINLNGYVYYGVNSAGLTMGGTVKTDTGNIVLTGMGQMGGDGITGTEVLGGASIISAGGGTITMTGNSSGTTGNQTVGLDFRGYASTMNNVSLTGGSLAVGNYNTGLYVGGQIARPGVALTTLTGSVNTSSTNSLGIDSSYSGIIGGATNTGNITATSTGGAWLPRLLTTTGNITISNSGTGDIKQSGGFMATGISINNSVGDVFLESGNSVNALLASSGNDEFHFENSGDLSVVGSVSATQSVTVVAIGGNLTANNIFSTAALSLGTDGIFTKSSGSYSVDRWGIFVTDLANINAPGLTPDWTTELVLGVAGVTDEVLQSLPQVGNGFIKLVFAPTHTLPDERTIQEIINDPVFQQLIQDPAFREEFIALGGTLADLGLPELPGFGGGPGAGFGGMDPMGPMGPLGPGGFGNGPDGGLFDGPLGGGPGTGPLGGDNFGPSPGGPGLPGGGPGPRNGLPGGDNANEPGMPPNGQNPNDPNNPNSQGDPNNPNNPGDGTNDPNNPNNGENTENSENDPNAPNNANPGTNTPANEPKHDAVAEGGQAYQIGRSGPPTAIDIQANRFLRNALSTAKEQAMMKAIQSR